MLSEIVQVSGQLWLGQLVSLMRSVNKWPISLDIKSISASVCGKACALVQAASAALFLVDPENSELLLVYSPALATGRGKNARVPIGRGLVGAAAARAVPVRSGDVKNEVEYEKEFDLLANKQGSVGPPDSMLWSDHQNPRKRDRFRTDRSFVGLIDLLHQGRVGPTDSMLWSNPLLLLYYSQD